MDIEVLSFIDSKFIYDTDLGLCRVYKNEDKVVNSNVNNTLKAMNKVLFIPKVVWYIHHGEYPDDKSFGYKDGNSNNFRIENLIPLWDDGSSFDSSRLKEIFNYEPETGLLSRRYNLPGAKAGLCNTHLDGYYATKYFGKTYLVHRLIWIMHNGPIIDDMVIDHINHDRKDNRLENLRLVTRQENAMNTSAKNKANDLPMGITLRHGRYRARIDSDGEQRYLGTYDTIDEAKAAWNAAKTMLGFHVNHGT